MTTWSHDQFWWRNADGWRTTVTLWGGWLRPLDHPVPIDCRVYDPTGVLIDAWQQHIDPTMVWSDDWNSPIRRHAVGSTQLRAYTRAWLGPDRVTSVLMANPGIPGSNGVYDLTASYTMVVTTDDREVRRETREVAPHATIAVDVAALCRADPIELEADGRRESTARRAAEVAIVEIISNFDLAMIQITSDTRSGAIGVEHLMAGRSPGDGGHYFMAGG